jgi:hydroxymethylglutaryl-CoA lyase
MKERIVINDVGPRDGLQNQPRILEPGQRLRLIESLLAAGMRHIEAGAFVSPKAVPAMAGAAELFAALPERSDTCFTALIPNMKGYELATAAGAKSVCMVLYATDGMAQANVRMSKAQAADVAADILARSREDGVRVTSTVSVAFECPFDGPVDPALVIAMAEHFLELGSDEVCIADTIGAANPVQVKKLMAELVAGHGGERLSCHFHDTRAMGVANVFAAVEAGIRKFDASIGRLGGCPFAPGAAGNVATEDVNMMLTQAGFETGIDDRGLMRAADLANELTGNAPGGRSRPWLDRHYGAAAGQAA